MNAERFFCRFNVSSSRISFLALRMSSFRSRFIAPRPTPKSRSEVKARSSAKFGKTEKRESSLSGRTRRPVAATSATVSQQGIKTSSNAERRGARDENKAPSSVTVEFQNVMDQAARTIQAWYRSQRTSRQQANLALHSLLTKKKQERTRLELLARQEKASRSRSRKRVSYRDASLWYSFNLSGR